VSRCVHRAFLLGEEPHDRKVWIEARIEELSQVRVPVGCFSIMDNRLHVLLRLDQRIPSVWSDE
jgi:hypothetical protein